MRATRVRSSEGAGVIGGGSVVSASVAFGRRPRRLVVTNAPTILDLLLVMRLPLTGADIVRPARRITLAHDVRIRVIRVRKVENTVLEGIPFRTLIQYSKDMDPADAEVLTEGRPGSALRTYLIVYRNGQEFRRTVLSEQVIAPAVDRVEVWGAKAPPPSRPPSPPNIQYGDASWYFLNACYGMHAAHRTLPFGTEVTVTNLENGKSVTVVINDRGPYGNYSRIIDLCPDAFAVIAPLSQGVAHVSITW
jgi:hypothetical protein